eukprot:gene16045-19094_t
MKWFFDLKIATKLILSFGAVLLLTAALGVSAIFSMARINDASTDLSANWMPSVLAAMSMRSDVSDFRRWELAHMLAAQDSDMALNETRMTETQAKLKTDGDKYRALISEPGEKEVFERFLALNDEFMRLHATMLSLSREMKKEEARALAVGPSAKVMTDMMVALDKLVAINTDGGARSSASADATYAASRASLIGLLVGIVAVGMLLALWVARSVARPLVEAVGVARQVAAGDLTAHIVVQSITVRAPRPAAPKPAVAAPLAVPRKLASAARSTAPADESSWYISSTQKVQPLWQHSSLPGLTGGWGWGSWGRAMVDMVAEGGSEGRQSQHDTVFRQAVAGTLFAQKSRFPCTVAVN